MKSIIITGASGFVGRNLTYYLQQQNYEVQALSLPTIEWKKEINQSADTIIHLAGKAHYTTNKLDVSEYFKANTDLTRELFECFINSDIKDFFYFSSVKAVLDFADCVVTEDVIGKPATPYGQSKLKAEEYILLQPQLDGKRVFIIRPCMIHGPGNKGNLNLLYNLVKKGIPWPLAAYDNKRSFLSIDNLNYLIDTMPKSKTIESGVYNFADDEALSTNKLVAIIAEASEKKTRLWSINKKLMNIIVKVGNRLNLPLNTERMHKLTKNYEVSNAKIKSALRIGLLPLTAEEGVMKTINSLKK